MIDYINKELLVFRADLCVKLYLSCVTRIQKAVINGKNYLKINFETAPNKASYEVLLKWSIDLEGGNRFFIDSPNLLSRNNAYKKQADCLLKAPEDKRIHVDLRKFCYCQKQT